MPMYPANMASGYQLQITADVIAQSVQNNQSLVHYELRIVKTNPGIWNSSAAANTWRLYLDGTEYHSSTFTYNFNGVSEKLLLASDRWVQHNSDGTRANLAISATVSTSNIGSATASGSLPFATIARASTVSLSNTERIVGEVLTINIARASSSFTHTLRWVMNGSSGTIATGVGTTYAWTLPPELSNAIPDATSWVANIYADTYSGTTKIGTTQSPNVRIHVPTSVVPTIATLTVAEATAGVASTVGAFVQNVSKLLITAGGEQGAQGSTIVSRQISVAGQTLSGLTGTTAPIGSHGSVDVVATVTDSRGRVGTKILPITVLRWQKPIVTLPPPVRTTSAAGTTASDEGTFIRFDLTTVIQSLMNTTERNAATYTIAYRAAGTTGSWIPDRAATARPIGASTAAVMGVATLPASDAREYLITVTDRYGVSTAAATVATAAVFMHWDGVIGVGVGKYRTNGTGTGIIDALGQIYQNNGQAVLDASSYVTQPVAEAGVLATGIMSPLRTSQSIASRLLAHKGVFFARATGTVTRVGGVNMNATVSLSITFPAGRFTVPPNVVASSSRSRITVGVLSITTSGASLILENWSNGNETADTIITWSAEQATSASASG